MTLIDPGNVGFNAAQDRKSKAYITGAVVPKPVVLLHPAVVAKPKVVPRPAPVKPKAPAPVKASIAAAVKKVALPPVKVMPSSAGITPMHPAVAANAPAAATAAKPTVTGVPKPGGALSAAQIAEMQSHLPPGDPYRGLTQKQWSDIMQRATQGVSVELDPQIQALKDNATLTQKQAERLQQLSDMNTAKTVAEQKDLYSRLVAGMQQMAPQIQQTWDQNGQAIGANYANLQNALQQRFTGATSATNNELNRLNLGNAAAQAANQQTGADANFLQGLAQSDAASAQTSVQNNKSAALQNLLNNIGAAQNQGTSLTAKTLSDALAATNERNNNTADALTQMLSQANIIESTRKGKIYEAENALGDQQRQMQIAAQQQAFDNAIAKGELDVKQQLAGTDATYKGMVGQADLTKAKAAVTSAQADTIKAQAAQVSAAAQKAGVDAKALDLAIKQSQATFSQNTHNYGTGINGALAYMSAKAGNAPTKNGQSAYQVATNMFNDIVHNVKGVKDLPSALADVQKRQKTNGYPQSLINVINNALTMYYQGNITSTLKPDGTVSTTIKH